MSVKDELHRFAGPGRHEPIGGNRLWLILPILGLPAVWPYISRGWPNSADGTLHLLRLVLLDHHIIEGFFYPRWVPELMLGNGYPVFSFYAPATYYLAEGVHLLGLGYTVALMTTFAILIMLAGFGAYRLASDMFGHQTHWAALVAAVAYMYTPYLISNVFMRGALAEVGAQALLPWIFWSLRRLVLGKQPWRYLPAVMFSLGGLAFTHNITLLFATPVLLLYTLVIWWQSGHSFKTLFRTGIGFVAAMGISTVFWLPLIAERDYLADTAFDVAILLLQENVWAWSNFVDLHLAFEYTFTPPYQLGWLQLALAVVGFVLARRRDGEWLYLAGVAILLSLAIGAWTLPLWLNVEFLQIAQFPWRLLGIISLPPALFAGALVRRLPNPLLHRSAAIVLVTAIILVQRPQLNWIEVLPSADDVVRLSSISQFEMETGSLGTSSAQEFVPRWVQNTALYIPGAEEAAPTQDLEISVHAANAFQVSATVTSRSDSFLRFATFYFPGWEVRIDGTPQETYPSTNLGLLTVELPTGEHEVELLWSGTRLQRWAGIISLITLSALALFCWGIGQRRWAIVSAILGGIALAATFHTPAPSTLQTAPQRIAGAGVELVGYATSQEEQFLSIRPYWHVRTTPDPDFRLRWQLQDANGVVVATLDTRPRYNGMQASNWPAGTLVDDAYELILPPELTAGQYQLALQLDSGDTNAPPPAVLGAVTLAATPPAVNETPSHALRISFGGILSLAGYNVGHQDQEVITNDRRPMIVTPGEWVSYTLFWQPLTRLPTNYHGFIHLVDINGDVLAQKDQIAGSLLRPPLLWDPYNLQVDRYALLIPQDAPGGLYRPRLGLYDFATLERLPAYDVNDYLLPNGPELPPVKVVSKTPLPEPAHPLMVEVGTIATLLGYDLNLPDTTLRPGDSFRLTLTYEAKATTDIDYTQFIHLYHPQLGMAAQMDTSPAGGGNPTWAWVPGEIIVESITLTISPDTPSGEYELFVGLYNPVNGERLPLTQDDGAPLPNGQVAVERLTILSAE
ncbi:hypothetical protein GC175_10200 [bacterium]|nr:hypothetical protein [bacterium]